MTSHHLPDHPLAGEIIELSVLVASIAPHPIRRKSCRITTCNGERGWYGIVTTNNPVKPYQVMVCCGEVGLGELALQEKLLSQMRETTKADIESAIFRLESLYHFLKHEILAVKAQTEPRSFSTMCRDFISRKQ